MGTVRIHHSKRFAAATVDQLAALRKLISDYVHNHWRAHHAAGIEKRREIGARLIAVQPPAVRLDCTIAQMTAMVDRVFADNYTPALPDSLVRLK